MTTRIA